jgi:hypothetical protein
MTEIVNSLINMRKYLNLYNEELQNEKIKVVYNICAKIIGGKEHKKRAPLFSGTLLKLTYQINYFINDIFFDCTKSPARKV